MEKGNNPKEEVIFTEKEEVNSNLRTKKYSWWKYDDEYITGWQYMGRSIVGALLSIILVGFYLQAVTAYKRAKSLGNSSSACNFFSVWGALSLLIGLIPGAVLINIIPHWYLWFSNGNKFSDSMKQEILGTINQLPVEELILLVDQNHISLDEMITSGLNNSKQEEIIKEKNINLFPVDTDSNASEDWVCEKCNEKIGGNFDSCWNCSSNEK